MSNGVNPLLARLLNRIPALSKYENLEVEFKLASRGIPHDLWETVSAFANTVGGWILLGVDNDGDVQGISNPDQRLLELRSTLRNTRKVSFDPCLPTDIEIEKLPDSRSIIVMLVRQAPRGNQPVFIDGNAYEGTFVRRHSGDFKCTVPEVNRKMRESSGSFADGQILPDLSVPDLNPSTIAAYRANFQVAHRAAAQNALDDTAFLRYLGAYDDDDQRGLQGVTLAGLLMFGQGSAIRQWRSRHLIDFRLRGDGDGEEEWSHRIAWDENLFDAFYAIYPHLVSGLPVPFRLQGPTRQSESFAHGAIREAFVNLLAHADYSEPHASLIKRSPEGFSFRNPGDSRVPRDDMLRGDRSEPRNPNLIFMLRQLGLAEEAGRGIPQILDAWHRLGLQPPDIHSDTERYEFRLLLRQAHLFSQEDLTWLYGLGDNWHEIEQVALVHAKNNGTVNNEAVRQQTNQHPHDVSRRLSGLRNRGLLTQLGSGRKTMYALSQTARPPVTTPTGQVLLFDPRTIWNSVQSPVQSPVPIDPATYAQFERIRSAPRVSGDVMRAAIMHLCNGQFRRVVELADVLGRSPFTLRLRYIKDMVDRGLLQPKFPNPSHPRQAYQVATDFVPLPHGPTAQQLSS